LTDRSETLLCNDVKPAIKTAIQLSFINWADFIACSLMAANPANNRNGRNIRRYLWIAVQQSLLLIIKINNINWRAMRTVFKSKYRHTGRLGSNTKGLRESFCEVICIKRHNLSSARPIPEMKRPVDVEPLLDVIGHVNMHIFVLYLWHTLNNIYLLFILFTKTDAIWTIS